MALQLERPAADVGLDALIRSLEQQAPHCRVLGGDATATWPAQLRWPELLHTVAVAGPVQQLVQLRATVLAPTAATSPATKANKVARKITRLAQLGCQACTEPTSVPARTGRSDWAERARTACAQLAKPAA
jgi:hypothetical protein